MDFSLLVSIVLHEISLNAVNTFLYAVDCNLSQLLVCVTWNWTQVVLSVYGFYKLCANITNINVQTWWVGSKVRDALNCRIYLVVGEVFKCLIREWWNSFSLSLEIFSNSISCLIGKWKNKTHNLIAKVIVSTCTTYYNKEPQGTEYVLN